jgi:cysteate synthase
MIPKYRIRCVSGGEIIPDMTALSCPSSHNSLLRTEYSSRKLQLAPFRGIFRYLCWLPVTMPLLPSGGPVTFTSAALSQELGLSKIFISFSGYCPEREASLTTGSFKELEALPTLQRLWELGKKSR